MSSNDSHDTQDHDGTPHPAPTVPDKVQDEAADSPAWLPFLGLGLVALFAIGLAVSSVRARVNAEEAARQKQVEAAEAQAAVAEAAAAEQPAPAPEAAPH